MSFEENNAVEAPQTGVDQQGSVKFDTGSAFITGNPPVETAAPEDILLAGQFKNDEDGIKNLEKSYLEAKKFISSTRRIDPPEQYSLNISKELGDVSLEENDPLLSEFRVYAKEHNFSQEQFDSVVNFHLKNQLAQQNASSAEFSKELELKTLEVTKELGYQKPEQAKEDLKRWIINNGGAELADEIDDLLFDPLAIKFMGKLKNNTNLGVPIPSAENKRKDGEYFMTMRQDPRYLKNIEFTKQIDAEFAEAVARGVI